MARELVLTALEHGKHVVTANKALIAEHGMEIFSIASSKGLIVAYEAAVAGGIPIIKACAKVYSQSNCGWRVVSMARPILFSAKWIAKDEV